MKLKKILIPILISGSFLMTGCSNNPSFGEKVERTYYTGGSIQTERVWKNSSKNSGVYKEYNFDGKLMSTVPLVNGVKNGTQKLFDKNNRVIRKTEYIDGKIHGQEKSFYPNGDTMLTFTYKNGVKEGNAYLYYQNGKVFRKEVYRNGKKVS